MNLSPEQKKLTYGALAAVAKGRVVLLKYWGHLQKVEEKFKAGLVSEADKESEEVIKKALDQEFPGYDFLGEETWFSTEDESILKTSKKPRWILDPLDGTTNYIHQFPIYCISLGLELNGEIVLGIIDVPALNETYVAVKGAGAYVNGQPIKVSSTEKLSQALIATGFFADDEALIAKQIKIFSSLVRSSRGVRRAGAAAYDLTQVARGVFDAFWEENLKPWDTAAGLLLVQEAGGTVTTYNGGKYNPYEKTILATNRNLNAAIVNEITNSCEK